MGMMRVAPSTHNTSRIDHHCLALALALLLCAPPGNVGAQIITTVAGGGVGDGGPATQATFRNLDGIAVDARGNVYVADTWNHRIQKFTADGEFVASWGSFGLSDAGLSAMWGPRALVVDDDGNVEIRQSGDDGVEGRVRAWCNMAVFGPGRNGVCAL